MKLRVCLPADVLLEQEVTKVKAEAENGWFCLLPRHVDFVSALVPGILCFEPEDKPEEYLAVDSGILVKCGPEVCVSTRNAVRGPDPGTLKQAVEKQFRLQHEREQATRVFEARLEADLVRQLLEVEKYG